MKRLHPSVRLIDTSEALTPEQAGTSYEFTQPESEVVKLIPGKRIPGVVGRGRDTWERNSTIILPSGRTAFLSEFGGPMWMQFTVIVHSDHRPWYLQAW